MKLLAQDVEKIFGKISPPPAIEKFGGTDLSKTGSVGISTFLSNLITLIYTLAAIVLLFMLLWGAWDWLTSEGDKEKLQSAQRKIINAIIGILLFAITFAVIAVLGQFTGFKFFVGQGIEIGRDASGNIIKVTCPDGAIISGGSVLKGNSPPTTTDLQTLCKGHGY